MATPIYHVRMSFEDRKNLEEMSKLYGAKSPAEFLREMVGSLCSGDQKRVTEFSVKLMTKMGEQLALDFANRAASTVSKPALEPKRRTKRVKRGGHRGRPA